VKSCIGRQIQTNFHGEASDDLNSPHRSSESLAIQSWPSPVNLDMNHARFGGRQQLKNVHGYRPLSKCTDLPLWSHCIDKKSSDSPLWSHCSDMKSGEESLLSNSTNIDKEPSNSLFLKQNCENENMLPMSDTYMMGRQRVAVDNVLTELRPAKRNALQIIGLINKNAGGVNGLTDVGLINNTASTVNSLNKVGLINMNAGTVDSLVNAADFNADLKEMEGACCEPTFDLQFDLLDFETTEVLPMVTPRNYSNEANEVLPIMTPRDYSNEANEVLPIMTPRDYSSEAIQVLPLSIQKDYPVRGAKVSSTVRRRWCELSQSNQDPVITGCKQLQSELSQPSKQTIPAHYDRLGSDVRFDMHISNGLGMKDCVSGGLNVVNDMELKFGSCVQSDLSSQDDDELLHSAIHFDRNSYEIVWPEKSCAYPHSLSRELYAVNEWNGLLGNTESDPREKDFLSISHTLSISPSSSPEETKTVEICRGSFGKSKWDVYADDISNDGLESSITCAVSMLDGVDHLYPVYPVLNDLSQAGSQHTPVMRSCDTILNEDDLGENIGNDLCDVSYSNEESSNTNVANSLTPVHRPFLPPFAVGVKGSSSKGFSVSLAETIG